MSFRQRFARFMIGRYGMDQFGQFLFGLSMFLIVISIFRVPYVHLLVPVIIVYSYFRIFSRNIYKRQQENNFYLKHSYAVRTKFNKLVGELKQRRTHHIYRCPGCNRKIRVPRGRGKIEIRCPKCSTTFIKNS